MIEYVLGGLLLTVLWMVYSCYYRPKRQLQKTSQLLRDLGYSVLQVPYHPFKITFTEMLEQGAKEHGDAFYKSKTQYIKVDVSVEYVLNKVSIVLVNPDLIKDLFSYQKTNIYPKYQKLLDGLTQLIGIGMGFTEGAVWKHRRRVINNSFNFDLIKQNIPKICQICDRKILEFQQLHKKKQGEFQYNLMELGNAIFNGVMMACFFGTDEIKEKIKGQDFNAFMVKLMDEGYQLSFSPIVSLLGKKAFAFGGLTPHIRQLLARFQIFKSIAKNIIVNKIQEVSNGVESQKSSNLISNLVKEQQKQKQQGTFQSISNDDILAQFSGFIVGGTDTTAHLFLMMIYSINKNPQIQRRVRKEIDQFIREDQDYNYQNLKKIIYIDWIQLQCTRYYGPASGIFFRQAIQDNYIGKIPIKKGTLLSIQPVANHFSEKYFKNPEQFRPQRWQSECSNLKPYAMVVFGGGPRSCIGKQLALLQSKIATIKLFKKYQKIDVPQEKLKMVYKFLYQPEPFKMTFKRANLDNP